MAKQPNKKRKKRKTKKEITELLLNLFRDQSSSLLSLKQIYNQLDLKTHPQKMLCRDIVDDLVKDDYLVERNKRYTLNRRGVILTGTFQRKSNGKNSFLPEDGGEPIFVAERNSGHAMNNDKVRIALCS